MKRIFALLLVFSFLASASYLDRLMQRYKRAPENQRYKIMNQIKLEIARLQRSRQQAAISKLRQVVSATASKQTKKRTKHTKKSGKRDTIRQRYITDHTSKKAASSAMDAITGGFSGSYSKSSGSVGVEGGFDPSSGTSNGGSVSGGDSAEGGFGPGGGFGPSGGYR